MSEERRDSDDMTAATALLQAPYRRLRRGSIGCREAGRLGSIEGTAHITAAAKVRGATDDQLLAFVVAGREARRGDAWDLATAAWRHLAARHHDRVRGLVVAFRFPGHPDVRIGPDEYEDAAQECFIRAVKMLGNFRGVSRGEFLGALRTCVTNTCMDYCRRRLTRERQVAGSIDEPSPAADGDAYGRFDAAVGEIAERTQAQHTAARDELASLKDAISRLENEQMRAVLRSKMLGYSSAEVGAELNLSIANVDKLCSRGVRKLREVMSDD